MKTKFDTLKSEWWVTGGLIALVLALLWICAELDNTAGAYSWEQTSHDFKYQITAGTVRVVNPLGHPVSVFVADSSGVNRYFQKIPGGMTSVPMPVSEHWSCTVWDQQPISFIVIRKPSL